MGFRVLEPPFKDRAGRFLSCAVSCQCLQDTALVAVAAVTELSCQLLVHVTTLGPLGSLSGSLLRL